MEQPSAYPPDRPSASTHLLRLRRAFRPIIPVLRARTVRHSPLMTVPAIEAIHGENPETGIHVADCDQSVCVPDFHAECTTGDARPRSRWKRQAGIHQRADPFRILWTIPSALERSLVGVVVAD